MKKSLLILPLVLLASALALTACGGGSSGSGSGEETAIEEAIETSATSTDPSKCTEVQTEAFNKTETGVSGKEALKICEEEAEKNENSPKSVNISNVSVNGESATAEVEVTGSALNGQSIELELAKEEGDWKLNKFLSFTKYDGKALGEALEEELAKEEGVSASLAKCVGEGVAEGSQEEAEALAFEKDFAAIEKIVKSCE